MAGTPFPFPLSAFPGRRPGESQGDLLNLYTKKEGEELHWERVPGLSRFTPVSGLPTSRIPRGQLQTTSYLLSAWTTNDLDYTTAAGVTLQATGEPLVGTAPIMMAHNQRQIPQVMIVTDLGVYIMYLDDMVIRAFPDAATLAIPEWADTAANLGVVNSVDYYSGYFVFTRANGDIVCSDLEAAGIPDLSEDKARHNSDGALRAFNNGETVLIMGPKSVEVWTDVGSSPFPLQFAGLIPQGLLSKWGVAGGPQQWEREVLYVASDYTVRMVQGYTATQVSTQPVQDDIYAYRDDPDLIQAQVYAVDGQAVFTISTPTWCWCYNLTTQQWHRRESYGSETWRGHFAAQFNNSWYVQDAKQDGLMQVTSDVYGEGDDRLVARLRSNALKDFPVSVRIPAVDIDCTVALGQVDKPYAEADPAMEISWSHDGGATWANPLVRSMGQQGRYGTKVGVRNLGRSTHHGVILQLAVSDPVPFSIKGAIAPTLAPSRARQVAR